jgi:uncharacterized protein YyaL (SSP411 family)
MQIVIVGDAAERRELAAAVASRYLPFATRIPLAPEHQAALAATLPFVAAMNTIEGRAAAYVCRDFTCREPVTAVEPLLAQLGPA